MNLIYSSNYFLKRPFPTDSNDIKVYKEIYKLDTDGWLVDRTNTVSFPWHTTLLDEYKLSVGPTQDFENCCLETAHSYLQQKKPIILMWSGGIDSTAMVVSFLCSTGDYSNLTIAFNNDSIKEYPDFYKRFICGRIKGISTEELTLKLTTSGIGDSILLSAEHADQLFGSPLAGSITQKLGLDFLSKPFNKENFEILFKTNGISEKSCNCWFDLYNETIKYSTKPILTMFDLAWWHGFNFRWQSIGLKMFPRINQGIKYKTFYSGAGFQQWSVNQTLSIDTIEQLKSAPKDFIFNFNKDTEYRNTKIKHPSSTLYYAKPAASAITEDFIKVFGSTLNMSDYYNPNNSINKWLTEH